MSKLIKQIGDEHIYFDDCQIENWKVVVSIIAILAIIIASLLFMYAPPTTNLENESLYLIGNIVLCIIMGILLATLCMLLIIMMSPKSWFSDPGYNIYISGHSTTSGCSIYIKSTSPEEDQIAICKAAKELEPKAKEFDDHEKELERIASKCK